MTEDGGEKENEWVRMRLKEAEIKQRKRDVMTDKLVYRQCMWEVTDTININQIFMINLIGNIDLLS